MRLLFAISLASFCSVLWIALSVARRVLANRRGKASVTGDVTTDSEIAIAPAVDATQRKYPQSTRQAQIRSIGFSNYDDAMGDLTDPYTNSHNRSGTYDRPLKHG